MHEDENFMSAIDQSLDKTRTNIPGCTEQENLPLEASHRSSEVSTAWKSAPGVESIGTRSVRVGSIRPISMISECGKALNRCSWGMI